VNPHSLRVVQGFVEPSLAGAAADQRWQFERHGYFVTDRVDHRADKPVFNKITGLKDCCAMCVGAGSTPAQHDGRGVVPPHHGPGEQVVLARLLAERIQQHAALRIARKGQRAAGLEQRFKAQLVVLEHQGHGA
jgi:hypothetical protein